MNKTRILDLADIIENHRLRNVKFDMKRSALYDPSINHECGTVACIAGWTICAAYGNKRAREMAAGGVRWTQFAAEAARILGLGRRQAEELFTPLGYNYNRGFNAKAAVATLRRLVETGRVSWKVKPIYSGLSW